MADGSPKAQISDGKAAFFCQRIEESPRRPFHLWSTTRQLDDSTLQCRIQLSRALEMFFGQLGHTKVLEPASNHPMEKWIIGGELIGLPFMTIGFFDLA